MSAQESPLGTVFGRVADAYDRARPSYPPEAPPPAARHDPGAPETGDAEAPVPPDDPGMQLIDFR